MTDKIPQDNFGMIMGSLSAGAVGAAFTQVAAALVDYTNVDPLLLVGATAVGGGVTYLGANRVSDNNRAPRALGWLMAVPAFLMSLAVLQNTVPVGQDFPDSEISDCVQDAVAPRATACALGGSR